MRPFIPHQTIIRSFFWPYSAEDIAWFLSRLYHQPLTAARIKDMWIEESAFNPMLQVDRPVNGFPPSDEVKLKEKLAA